MSSEHQQAEEMRDDVPSTIARSDDKAVRTYKRPWSPPRTATALASAPTAPPSAALKHTHEKVGDHWEPKDEPGPSDAQAEQKGSDSLKRPKETAEGVDANATKAHLLDVAKKLGVTGAEPDAQGRARRRDPQGQRPGDPEGAFVMTHEQVDTAVFDVDGTLVDTNYHHALSWYLAFRRFDIVLPVWRLHRAIGMGGDNLGRTSRARTSRSGSARSCAARGRRSSTSSCPRSARSRVPTAPRGGQVPRAPAGVGELGEARAHGGLPRPARRQGHRRRLDDLRRRRGQQARADLVSVAMEKVGGTRAVMIGDSVWDAISAREVGVPTIAVRTGGFSTDELRDAGAEWVFDSQELRDDIEKTPLGSGG